MRLQIFCIRQHIIRCLFSSNIFIGRSTHCGIRAVDIFNSAANPSNSQLSHSAGEGLLDKKDPHK